MVTLTSFSSRARMLRRICRLDFVMEVIAKQGRGLTALGAVILTTVRFGTPLKTSRKTEFNVSIETRLTLMESVRSGPAVIFAT